jgi:protein gp37
MGITSIEWTDRSVNPIRANGPDGAVGHYCEMVSGGCAHCYSSNFQPRFGMPRFKSKPNGATPFFDEERLKEVLTRKKPTKWFWCDMTDLFGSWVPDEWIDKCFAAMALTPHHTHQVLTKRPERMADYIASRTPMDDSGRYPTMPQWHQQIEDWLDEGYGGGRFFETGPRWDRAHDASAKVTTPLPNVWLGTSIEAQAQQERLQHLLNTPAAIRFVSAEPLIDNLDLGLRNWADIDRDDCRLDWVIVGGESGHGARPCNINWIRLIVEDCRQAGVACFVKQLGAKPFEHSDTDIVNLLYPDGVPPGLQIEGRVIRHTDHQLKHRKGGDISEWPVDLRVRQFPREVAHA